MELIKNLNQILVLIKIKKTNERRIKNNP